MHVKLLFIKMKRAFLGMLAGLVAGAAWASPRVPADDTLVLERLPLRRADPAAAELRRLREEDLIRRVQEARADAAAGHVTRYDDAEELIRDLELEDA